VANTELETRVSTNDRQAQAGQIHPTAHIHATARVETGASVGAHCIIHAHAIVLRHCHLADGVVVHPFAVIGGDPQDLHFDPKTPSWVSVGAQTTIREHVTISRATRENAATEVGTGCYLMASSHVAHDCVLGDGVILANAVLLGGHVRVEERAFVGGGAVVHQHCRIGRLAMVGGGSRISQDVPRYCMTAERNALIGLNIVGLRRNGVKQPAVRELKAALRSVLGQAGNASQAAAAALSEDRYASSEAAQFLQFFQGGRRGFTRPRSSAKPGSSASDEL
jgi:UDP-N-acetylglucosamine acyltransferase